MIGHPRQERGNRPDRRRLDAGQRHASSCLLGAVLDILLHCGRHVRALGTDRRLSGRCRLSAAAGRHRVGIQWRGAAVRHARRHLARRRDRPPPLGAVQLRDVDHRHWPALASEIISQCLAAHRIRRDVRQHDRLARSADHRNRDENLSR